MPTAIPPEEGMAPGVTGPCCSLQNIYRRSPLILCHFPCRMSTRGRPFFLSTKKEISPSIQVDFLLLSLKDTLASASCICMLV